MARLGQSLVGIEQVKQWSISSVLRVRTDGPDFYFKVSAPLPLFVEEGPVTAMLASRFPGYVPAPLAVEPERGWMLLPDFGELIGWQAPLEVQERACSPVCEACSVAAPSRRTNCSPTGLPRPAAGRARASARAAPQ